MKLCFILIILYLKSMIYITSELFRVSNFVVCSTQKSGLQNEPILDLQVSIDLNYHIITNNKKSV